MMQNDQAVPAGIPGGQQASPNAPAQPAYDSPMLHSPQQAPQAPQPPQQHLAQPQQAPQQPTNPFSQQQPPAQEQAPAEPAVKEPEQPKEPEPKGPQYTADTIVGDLKSDSYAAVGITYIEDVCGGKVDFQRAFGNAVERGDTSLIDEAYLKETLGDKAKSVIDQAKAVFTYSAEKGQKALETVYADFGGEAQVRQMGAYYNEHADPAEKAVIKAMLDSGKPDQVKYAVSQIKKYAEGAGMVLQHHGQPLGVTSGKMGLSKADYVAKLQESRNMPPEQYDQLRELRKLGMQQGL